MIKQRLLPLDFAPTYAEEDFCISHCNIEAFLMLSKWPDWGSHALIIYGTAGSGKTHLAKIWQRRTKALNANIDDIYGNHSQCFIFENAENIQDETALLHLYNATKENNGYLLITSNLPPAELNIKLPDLRSRINAVTTIRLGSPDNDILQNVFIKLMTDRQLNIKPEIINYIISYMPKSFSVLHEIVAIIDKEAMEKKQKITIPFIKQNLEHLLDLGLV